MTLLAKQNEHDNCSTSIDKLNLYNESDLSLIESYLNRMIKSDKGGIKTIAEGIAIFSRAKDLGLPFTSCIEHIHVINGKTGVDVHIIKALLSKAGVTWKCTKDYAPLYEYTDGFNVFTESNIPCYARIVSSADKAAALSKESNGDLIGVYIVNCYKDFQGNIYKSYQLNSKFKIAVSPQDANEISKSGLIPVYRIPSVPIDYVYEYELYRQIKLPNGEYVNRTSIGRFSYADAVAADLFSKDTYKKYFKTLISHRAFTYGARDIASDVIMGCMETSELKIINGLDINPDDIQQTIATDCKTNDVASEIVEDSLL